MGKSPSPSYCRRASTRGPLLRARARALGWPAKRCRQSVRHASLTSGRWGRVFPARWSAPAPCRPTACCAAAQSRPLEAANSCGVPLGLRPLQAGMSAAAGARPACVGRRREREPVRRQALRMRGATQGTGRCAALWSSIKCAVSGMRHRPVHVLLSPRATSQVCPVSSGCQDTLVLRRRGPLRQAGRFIYNMLGHARRHRRRPGPPQLG